MESNELTEVSEEHGISLQCSSIIWGSDASTTELLLLSAIHGYGIWIEFKNFVMRQSLYSLFFELCLSWKGF